MSLEADDRGRLAALSDQQLNDEVLFRRHRWDATVPETAEAYVRAVSERMRRDERKLSAFGVLPDVSASTSARVETERRLRRLLIADDPIGSERYELDAEYRHAVALAADTLADIRLSAEEWVETQRVYAERVAEVERRVEPRETGRR